MSTADLLFIYAIAGTACAVAIFRRSSDRGARRWGTAALAVPLWPLWAPIALTARSARFSSPAACVGPAVLRIRAALEEGVVACEGTPLAKLLSRDAAGRVLAEVARVEARASELAGLLTRRELDPEVAAVRVAELENQGVPPRILATARLHLENANRLAQLLSRDQSTLLELAGLVEALRTQLVLARYAGASAEGVGHIVTEVWARLEGLDEAMEALPMPMEGTMEPRKAS